MPRQISDERKTAYYVGMGLQVLGGLLFASTCVTFLMHFGDFSHFEARAKSHGFRAFGGMALLIVGGIIRGVGAKGLAGSGVSWIQRALATNSNLTVEWLAEWSRMRLTKPRSIWTVNPQR